MKIYRKTAKGMNELIARRSSLDSNLNSMLLLADGERSEAEITRLGLANKMPPDALQTLVHGGYLELVEAPGKQIAAARGKTASAGSAIQAPEPVIFANNVAEVDAFRSLYSSLVQKTRALLGMRGLVFQLRLEQARTFNDLTALIAPLGEAVAKRHGLEAGMNFVQDCNVVVSTQRSNLHTSQFNDSDLAKIAA